MDKVNFTSNEVPVEADYNNIGVYSETGIGNIIKALISSTSGNAIFKNSFPVLSVTNLGATFTITATWAAPVGVAVGGQPAVIAAGSVTSAPIATPAVTTSVEIRVRRVVSDVSDNRTSLDASGVSSIVAFVVKKEEAFSVVVVESTAPMTDYFVWKTCTVNNLNVITAQVDATTLVPGWV